MALFHKLGSYFRQTISQNGPAPMTSMLNSTRSMSSSKLFIGGLSFGTDDQSLMERFHLLVMLLMVITDRESGRSRGFGFVNFSNDESASSAMSALDGQELNGRSIRVSFANDRSAGPCGGGGFRGDGGYGTMNSGF